MILLRSYNGQRIFGQNRIYRRKIDNDRSGLVIWEDFSEDPFPQGGDNTACDALWMGQPAHKEMGHDQVVSHCVSQPCAISALCPAAATEAGECSDCQQTQGYGFGDDGGAADAVDHFAVGARSGAGGEVDTGYGISGITGGEIHLVHSGIPIALIIEGERTAGGDNAAIGVPGDWRAVKPVTDAEIDGLTRSISVIQHSGEVTTAISTGGQQ
jgi:hypothetical protein